MDNVKAAFLEWIEDTYTEEESYILANETNGYSRVAFEAGYTVASKEIALLRTELEAEKKTRIKYQGLIYKACNALDDAFNRSVRGGEGTTCYMVAPDISFLNRLRKEAIKRAEDAEKENSELREQH